MALDTLEIAEDLRAAGFSEEQARAVTRAVRKAHDVDFSNLMTKADGAALRADFETLRADMAELKGDLIKWVVGMNLATLFGLLGVLASCASTACTAGTSPTS